ncbi:MAG: hypothetical protein P4L34_07020 [Paludibacter sp.]|nr:hypothetical protein [Paludibacter sp.]
MKKSLTVFLSIGLGLFLSFQAHAENSDSIKVKKSGFVVGLKYLSNNVYLGRIDSANIMYLVPSIGYYHKSGLHVAASLSYQLDAGLNKIDVFSFEGGYDFSIGEQFSGGLSVEKDFYDSNSISLNSVNNLGVSSNFSYDFDIVSLNIGAGLAFNDKTDIITEFGLNKSFEIGKLVIEPNIKFNAGTQNYYNSYLIAGKSHITGNTGHGKGIGSIKSNGKSKSGNNGTTTTTTTTTAATYSVVEASTYKVLDYEISVPISYSLHNFKFDLVPTYAIPVNAATILSSTGSIEKENISNHFILQFEIAYKFY